jgi:hypothetical protein
MATMRRSIRPLLDTRLLDTSTSPVLPFLCPALLIRSSTTATCKKAPRVKQAPRQLLPKRHLHTSTEEKSTPASPQISSTPIARALPTTCPGCGALSQTIESNEAGYYSTNRGAVKAFLGLARGDGEAASAAPILAQLDEQTRQQYGLHGLLSSCECISRECHNGSELTGRSYGSEYTGFCGRMADV